ncbi:MAG: PqqD family protein [Limnochordia bacterium]|nr:PqqD family protein [Bacillota bacterium]
MSKLTKSDALVVREVDQETIILNTKTGSIHVLNPTGTIIWKLLDELDNVDAIVDAAEQLYDHSDVSAVQADVAAIIDEMISQGILCQD